MFESAELGHKVDKATYEQEAPALREALLAAQFDLWEGRRRPVIIPHRWGRWRRQRRDGEPAE